MLDLDDITAELASWLRGLAPRPRLTVSEWADRYRILPETSAEPGPWRTSRVPYLREPQDLSSATSAVKRVVVKKAAQLGFSEMLNNIIGYSIHQDPCPILLVQPTEQTAEKYSKKRIAPMVEASPVLRALVADSKTRSTSNTLLSKEFPAGSLTMVGSNAPAGLASLAARRGLLDERDRFARDAGGEGDVGGLVTARLTTFANSQLVEVSTPTIAGDSPIDAAYADSDQREYEVPCPHCSTFQPLRWERVKWPPGDPAAARYVCAHCETPIEESAKPWMLARGEWVARNPGHPTAGFFISGLYSPWVSISEIAVEFAAAARDPKKLQVWVNTRLGETWDPLDATDLDESQLVALREPYDASVMLPAGVAVITAAVDVQDDRLELEFSGWGSGQERWHLDLVVLQGDPSTPTVWQDLDRHLMRTFPAPKGLPLPVAVTCIDSGGHHTMAVYDFCRVRHARRVYAVKGSSDPTRSPFWPKRPSKSAKGGNVDLYVLGVSIGKDAIRAAILGTLERRAPTGDGEAEASGPGMEHWPISASYGRAYFEQLTAEQPVIRYHRGRPQRVWHLRKGRRNEAFDLAVYGLAGLEAWKALGYSLEAQAAARAQAPTHTEAPAPVAPRPAQPPAPAPRPPAPRPQRQRLPSFFNRP